MYCRYLGNKTRQHSRIVSATGIKPGQTAIAAAHLPESVIRSQLLPIAGVPARELGLLSVIRTLATVPMGRSAASICTA
ncbi:phosphoribosylcarboxyaminoimidazole (NCAIR) mutase [Rhodobacteraceae bacterium MBR-64]|jgi:phosphoribosylcarboxyaminoimidazole (NCAIR) mutase